MQPEAGTPILSVHALTKRFGHVTALDTVTMRFRRGEYFSILGPSGCGKTTLLRLVAGLENPGSGDVELDGRSLLGVPPERRPVNMVFQQYALFPHMSVWENVAFGLTVRKFSRDVVKARVEEVLQLVHLEGHRDRYPQQLSGGQQQRVALARALVNRPRVLLLDEPLAALDEKLRLAMQRELKLIQRELGITFIHVTHSQDEALALGDRLAIMNGGRVVQLGPPREIYARPVNRFVAEFLGSSNLIRARRADGHAGRIVGQDGLLLQVAETAAPQVGEAALNGEWSHYLIRPEHIRVSREPPAGATNVLRGTIHEVRQTGPKTEYTVRAGSTELMAHAWGQAEGTAPAEGEAVFLSIEPEHIVPLPQEDEAPAMAAAPA